MSSELLQRAQGVKLAIFDVDGVLTDGRLYFLTDGSE
ncbi:MAG: phenylphosphate carboxylase subunit delta, partial [Pseudomonas sp.]